MGFYVTAGFRRKKKPAKAAKARKPKLEFNFVDEPVQTGPPVWNVYADDHDGDGFRPVGQHHGNPKDFRPW